MELKVLRRSVLVTRSERGWLGGNPEPMKEGGTTRV
jgi:hypothetical protein